MHVFLREGRIAWATDTRHPGAFTRCLLEHTRIDRDTLREVVESCRRERHSLAETLATWGIATHGEVRAALEAPIRLALRELRDCAALRTVFLDRPSHASSHDATLTFSLDELDARVLAPQLAIAPVRRVRSEEATALEARVRASLDGVSWVDELGVDGTAGTFVAASVAAGTMGDGAELVAARRGPTTIAGVRLASGGSLWCRVESGVSLGGIVVALSSGAAAAGLTEAGTLDHEVRAVGSGDTRVASALRQQVEHSPEVLAAFLTDPSGLEAPFGAGRATADELAGLVARRASALVDREGGAPDRAMTTEARCHLFAQAMLFEGRTRLVWLVLDRAAPKGIAWRSLARLTSDLSDVPRAAD